MVKGSVVKNNLWVVALVALTLLSSACSGGGAGGAATATAPTITTQPVDQSVVAPTTATFTVVATGTAPLSYQWQRNGASISGATAASYTTAATSSADNGAIFTVEVGNSAGSIPSSAATLTVTAAPVAPAITTQPANQIVIVPAAATFSVVATGTAPLSYQWQRNGVNISGATAASYTTAATSSADNGASFTVTVSNAAGSVPSNAATLTITTQATGSVDVPMYHNDAMRTGQNLQETTLTLANVKSATFGKINFLPADGKVDAQPLYLSGLTIGGATHNVLYIVSEHDSAYAYDADTGALLWHQRASIVPNGEVPGDGMGCVEVLPEIGITSTPAIDRASGTIYLVAMSRDTGGTYHQRLHALSLTTGAEKTGSPVNIQATYPGSYFEGNSNAHLFLNFLPAQHKERMAPVLVNGVVYTSWSSHCDVNEYTGWVIGYNASSLAQTSVLAITPNSGFIGGALWSSNGAPAVDAQGNLFVFTGNGLFDTTLDANGFPSRQDYGNAFLKLTPTASTIGVADYFTMYNTADETRFDLDLGSGGAIVLPDLLDASGVTRHLSVGAGKDGIIYLADRDNMGKINTTTSDNRNIYQVLSASISASGEYGTPAYFNKTVYFGAVGDNIKAFTISNARLVATPSSKTATTFGITGATPSISANGTTNAILWAHENNTVAVLHAYDASNLATELYNSSQAANNRDQFDSSNKFIVPTIANGKVFVGTNTGVAVFGLLP